jgi:tetratricopeptide (TPR) repeat protein
LWDVETGKRRVLYRGEITAGKWQNIRTLAFSSDGQILAAGGTRAALKGYEVRAWNVETAQVEFSFDTGYCERIAFSPDGKTLAAALGAWPRPRGVQLWNLETRQLQATLVGHSEVVYHLAFSPDGRTLATGSWDSTVRLWHVATAQPLMTLKGNRGAIFCVAFSPDGKTLASSSQYRQAPRDALASDRLLWHAASDEDVLSQNLLQKPEQSTEAMWADPDGWRDRGRYHALRGEWKKAVAAYAPIIDASPIGDESFEYACLVLLAHDQLGYERFCRRLAQRAHEASSPHEAYLLARTLTAGPNPTLDSDQILQWAEKARTSAPESGLSTYVLGAAHYRAGNFEEAIRWSEESLRMGSGRIQQSLFLGMAHRELGHADESRRWFASAASAIGQLSPIDGFPSLMEWLGIQVLHREAEALFALEQQPSPIAQGTTNEDRQ